MFIHFNCGILCRCLNIPQFIHPPGFEHLDDLHFVLLLQTVLDSFFYTNSFFKDTLYYYHS